MNDEAEDPIDLEITEGRLPCPVCQEIMHVESVTDVTVDVCSEHGVWLDVGELEAIQKAARRHRRRSLQITRETARRQMQERGGQFGWWSLFWS